MVLIVRGHIIVAARNLSHVPRDADILVRFGERVRELRKRSGFSQEEFAERCGLDRTYVGGIERGERNLSLRNIAVIARALGVTLPELMKGL
jgi:transcriptional regulator with XRE-family HTH domain